MEIFEVINGPVAIPAGTVLQLSEDQAETRSHLLKPLNKNNLYEVMDETYFKNGEVITFRELPDKALLPAFFTPEQLSTFIAGGKKSGKKAPKPPTDDETE